MGINRNRIASRSLMNGHIRYSLSLFACNNARAMMMQLSYAKKEKIQQQQKLNVFKTSKNKEKYFVLHDFSVSFVQRYCLTFLGDACFLFFVEQVQYNILSTEITFRNPVGIGRRARDLARSFTLCSPPSFASHFSPKMLII